MPKKRETSSERYKKLIKQRRIFVLSVFVIVVMICICLFTPLFGVADITVSGNSVLSSEEVIATSGIRLGENVFRINASKAKKNLRSLAYVEGVEIKRQFPAHVEIVIDEAEADVILDAPTEFVVTTVNGRVLEITEDVTHLTSPIVYGIEVAGAEIAQNVIPADREFYDTNMEYIRCFYETVHWQNIDEFYVTDITNFMAVMKSGMKVTFGTIDSTKGLQRKIKMMTKILEQVEQTERSYLDLTTDKGYYGEYTQEELEEMQRKAEGKEVEEQAESDSNSNKENTEENKKEQTEQSKTSAKPSEPPEARKKATADSKSDSSSGSKTDDNS